MVADSGWPLSAGAYETAIRRSLPATMPPPHSQAPNALPRISFGTLFMDQNQNAYQYVMRTEWSELVDGGGRPVARTTMVCARYASGRRADLTTLYDYSRSHDHLLPNQDAGQAIKEELANRPRGERNA